MELIPNTNIEVKNIPSYFNSDLLLWFTHTHTCMYMWYNCISYQLQFIDTVFIQYSYQLQFITMFQFSWKTSKHLTIWLLSLSNFALQTEHTLDVFELSNTLTWYSRENSSVPPYTLPKRWPRVVKTSFHIHILLKNAASKLHI